MALEMSNATYARGSDHKTMLKTFIQSEMDSYAASLKGKGYENLVNTVKKYWSGADASRFLLMLEKNVSGVQKKVSTTYKNQIIGAIYYDYNKFMKTQNQNSSMIK